jgi:hypothetical protein
VGYSARRNEDKKGMATINQAMVLGAALLLSACGGSDTEAKTAAQATPGVFTYAPAIDRPHRETMRRIEETSIPGTPMREAEQWTMEWDVVTTRESNLFKRSLKLVGLKINVNGAEQLRGDEVMPAMATVDVLTDKDANVVDVRGSDQFSAAIVALGDAKTKPVLERIFSPARLKALVVVRSMELHSDLVGRPTPVGSQWIATDPLSGGTRQLRVTGEAPCAAARCLEVVRQYDVDKQAVFAEIAERIGAYVQAQGGDPSKVKLVGMDVKLEDTLLIDPATMDYHRARFNQEATIKVAGEKGELSVASKSRRETDVKY